MSSSPKDTLWPAEPHTLAKIRILEAYLDAYFQILGRAESKRGRGILYVDGFAGPGEYSNSMVGSPVAAVRSAIKAITTMIPAWTAGKITAAFFETDRGRAEHLSRRLATEQTHPALQTVVEGVPFVEGVAVLRKSHPHAFSTDAPLFAFIDPFGAKGVPFDTVADILRSPCSEVLINFDADGVGRICRAGDDSGAPDILRTVYGDDGWKLLLNQTDANLLYRQALELYKQKLRSIPGVDYVFSFEMRGATDAINYFLVFASKHERGLEKMKEAMRTVAQSGEFRFSDARVGQTELFRFDDPEYHAQQLLSTFQGQRVTWKVLNRHVLNETPFNNPIQMLKVLENSKDVTVHRVDPAKKTKFLDNVTAVTFTARLL